MIQLLTFIGKTKWGKLTYILICGLFLQSFSQQYGAYTEAWNTTPHDTVYLMRGTNQMYNRVGGVLEPSIIVNPLRHTPFWLINQWPANFDSATMQTKITQAQGDARYIQGPVTWASVTSKPSFATVATTGSYNDLSNKPTIPAAGKRVETFTGASNASGVYTVTFANTYSTAPNVQASITNQSATNQFIRVSNVTTTGCTVNVYARSAITLLSVEVLLAATTNVSGATVSLLVTEQ